MKGFLEQIKRHPYICVCIVEAVILIFGIVRVLSREATALSFDNEHPMVIDDQNQRIETMEYTYGEYESDNIHTDSYPIEPGIYDIEFSYSADNDVHVNLEAAPGWIAGFYSDNCDLRKGQNVKYVHRAWVNTGLDTFTIRVNPGESNVSFDSIKLHESSNSRLFGVIKLILLALLVNGIALLICFREKFKRHIYVIVGVGTITLLSSLGVTARYLPWGHDIGFHMLRIVGLGDALASGQIPSRVQPFWCNDWGYAVSTMYGDITLALPALMYKAGFTLLTSYKTFVVVVNLLTAYVSYRVFEKISKNKYAAMIVAFLYTMAPYRLVCIYTRAAVGEYTAMLFTPMVLLGFWYMFNEDTESESYGTKFLAPVLGITGLIQTHVLTTQMIGILILIMMLCEIRKLFRKKTIMYLLKMIGYIIWINAWFIIPFFRLYSEDFTVKHMGENMDARFQTYGVSLLELFTQTPNSNSRFNFEYLTNLNERCAMPLSNALCLIMILAVGLLLAQKLKNCRMLTISVILSLLSAWMATNLFPYFRINMLFPKIGAFLGKIQFAYRYLGIAIVFLAFTAAILFRLGKKALPKKIWIAIATVVLIIGFDQGLNTINAILYNGTVYTQYDKDSIDSFDLVSGEYLYADSNRDYCRDNILLKPNNADVDSMTRSGMSFEFNCSSAGDGAYVDVPAFNYPEYVAKDTNGNKLDVENGENHSVRVRIPSGYNGVIKVYYSEPTIWRITELISLVGFVIFIIKSKNEFVKQISLHKRGQIC